MRILVVEDEDDIRNNLLRLLRIEGFEVFAASNGNEGLNLARSLLPDLVLSDVMMPGLDGLGLLAALRRDPATRNMPLILVTARADQPDMRQGMNLGADDYLTKPFQRDDLLSAIRTRLERARAQQESSERLAREARRLQNYDATTGLPNRQHMLTLLDAALEGARRGDEQVGIVRVTLDQLDLIEQHHGRAGLTEALRSTGLRIAERIIEAEHASRLDAVGLLNEQEFLVLLNECPGLEALLQTAEAIRASLCVPLTIAGSDNYLTPSIGVAIFPGHGDAADALLACTATAAIRARREGGNRVLAFSPEMMAGLSERLRLHNDLHRALDLGQLHLCYQPQVDDRGQALGFEALLRWQHPELGMVPPTRFVPIAEENRQIIPIGAWVLRTACRQAQHWRQQGHLTLRIAVNLSAQQFAAPGLLATIERALSDSGLPASALEIEITEGTAMRDAGLTEQVLHALKAIGVTIAIDDFGTGYSSLAYLKRFPIDILKIDQSFVRHITIDANDHAIAAAVASLAHALGLQVIAEGVESQAHVEILRKLGCEAFQGYLFGKPMSPEAVTDWLLTRKAQTSG